LSSFGGAVSVAGSNDVSMIAAVPNERGQAWVVAGPDPFENARLAKDDNLVLLANIAARGKVCFDEYHHEFPEATPSRAGRLFGPVVAQILLCGLFVVFGHGRRFGASRPLRRSRSRSVSEYLTEMATLFGRARSDGEVSREMSRSLRRRLASRFGISPNLGVEDVDHRMRTHVQLGVGELAALLRRAEDPSQSATPEAFASLARELATMERRLLG
jgi:hypothetical protein